MEGLFLSVYTFTCYPVTCQSISSVAVTTVASRCVITHLSTPSTLCWVLTFINVYVRTEVKTRINYYSDLPSQVRPLTFRLYPALQLQI